MMTQQEFHRTNINLYSTDVEWLQVKFGHGWTEKVREWVHQEIKRSIERDTVQLYDRIPIR